ncbi:hypothetical protein ADICYQ_3826 [Cyclobacterium qasimii M12-11B]|uniref:Uncharacterized protein n=1 Tax=Cyclobacterium qasimii M12-11B TaxID=641524 RepID=S7VBC6_9BACT|nr:hypothetical protein ADICYQ_3826 [Cyclobacterium qasimii M12-11B]
MKTVEKTSLNTLILAVLLLFFCNNADKISQPFTALRDFSPT